MLISFSLENWMSFRDPVKFSMVASKERQHGERVPREGKYQVKILPIAALYGGNASGKSNFFKALEFARWLIVFGTQPDDLIPLETFRLDAGEEHPSRFTFDLLIDRNIYEFDFVLTREKILKEKLTLISSSSEKELYSRENGKLGVHESLAKKKEKKDVLQFIFQGTRPNQLFLTNSVFQNRDDFRPVYNWFRNTLKLIRPDSRFASVDQLMDASNPLSASINEILPQLDTGIARLDGEEIPFDSIPVSPFLRKEMEKMREGASVCIQEEPSHNRFVISKKNGALGARKLVACHKKTDGTEARFELARESDGTLRLIDLLPIFVWLATAGEEKVCVIDEIDRSLHALLTYNLLEFYLGSCTPESRSQLLLTTHDVFLMDQKLLRRDEMWVTERDAAGASTIYSFSEYKDVRYDKDIRKSYLRGRLGGIPRILPGGALNGPKTGAEAREAR